MKKQWIERKVPKYSTIAYLLHYSYFNEYPKNKEKFIWGISSKYEEFRDREISALVTSFIYDGSQKSIKAVMEVDVMFKGSPLKWLAKKQHCSMILETDQDKVIYGKIDTKALYYFFCDVYTLYSQYGSIYKRFQACTFDTLEENMETTFSMLSPFKGKSFEASNKRNMFMFLMAHCYNDYNVDEHQLVAPLFETQLVTCRTMGLISEKGKLDRNTAVELTDNLRWFSEQHPLTFWVGIFAYQDAVRTKDKMVAKLHKMKLTRRKFNKR